jgi:hypothetical protein
MPALLYQRLYHTSHTVTQHIRTLYAMGFLYNDLRERYFYWEITKMLMLQG